MAIVTFNHHPYGGVVVFADEYSPWRYDGASLYIRRGPIVGPLIEAHMKEAVRIAHHLRGENSRVELGTSTAMEWDESLAREF